MELFITSRREMIQQELIDRIREGFGRILEAFHAPAKIKEFEYVDAETNQIVYLSTGARYSVLHVGDKQYYFDRVTGRFDGTCTSLQLGVADRLEFSD